MSTSCFYKAKQKNYQPVSFLLMEAIGVQFESAPETPLNTLLESACIMCYGKRHGMDLGELAEAVTEITSDPLEAQDGKLKQKKSLGTSYMQWLSKASPDQLCFMLSGWDHEKARALYCDTDLRDVREMSEVFLEREWNKIQAAYECSMYGFGGSYKGDAANDADAQDLTKNNPSAVQLIKSLGF